MKQCYFFYKLLPNKNYLHIYINNMYSNILEIYKKKNNIPVIIILFLFHVYHSSQ